MARIHLQINDGSGQQVAHFGGIVLPDESDVRLELSFTGPDGAPWYVWLTYPDAGSSHLDVEGAVRHIDSYSDYELTSEVYRRITGGHIIEEHEPSTEYDK